MDTIKVEYLSTVLAPLDDTERNTIKDFIANGPVPFGIEEQEYTLVMPNYIYNMAHQAGSSIFDKLKPMLEKLAEDKVFVDLEE